LTELAAKAALTSAVHKLQPQVPIFPQPPTFSAHLPYPPGYIPPAQMMRAPVFVPPLLSSNTAGIPYYYPHLIPPQLQHGVQMMHSSTSPAKFKDHQVKQEVQAEPAEKAPLPSKPAEKAPLPSKPAEKAHLPSKPAVKAIFRPFLEQASTTSSEEPPQQKPAKITNQEITPANTNTTSNVETIPGIFFL
jgi:hypothetical protein